VEGEVVDILLLVLLLVPAALVAAGQVPLQAPDRQELQI
jgi:hypothetical protein